MEHHPVPSYDSDDVPFNAVAATTTTGPVSPRTPPNPNAVADAIERRLQQQRQESTSELGSYTAFDQYHEKRQEFRRLIEPGILRRNPKHITMESLRILLKLSENIMEHPDDQKYHKFKPTNEKIKTFIVDPKGTLEYAIALGFRPEVENFQPFYVFHKRHMSDLRIGNAIIKEMLEVEETKAEAQERARQEEKAAREAAKDKVKQAFMDDRKSTAYRLQREQIAREARGARQSSPPPAVAAGMSSATYIPGSGQTLNGEIVPETPPPYRHRSDQDDEEDEE